MRCYKHRDQEAIGMCKVCDKGVCDECAVEVDDFIFCAKHAKMEKAVKHAEKVALGELDEIGTPEESEEMEQAVVAQPAMMRQAVKKHVVKPIVPKKMFAVQARSLFTPALVGGIISGTPSGIPFLNFICIVWMLLGGAAAAYLVLLKESARLGVPGKLRYMDAAFAGVLSGIFGGSIAFVFGMFSGITFWQQMLDLLVSSGLDLNAADLLLRVIVVDPEMDIVSLLAKWLLICMVFPVFGAIGGLIAAKISEMT